MMSCASLVLVRTRPDTKVRVSGYQGRILPRAHPELSEAYKSAEPNLTFLTPDGAPRAFMLTFSQCHPKGKSVSATRRLATSFDDNWASVSS